MIELFLPAANKKKKAKRITTQSMKIRKTQDDKKVSSLFMSTIVGSFIFSNYKTSYISTSNWSLEIFVISIIQGTLFKILSDNS